MTETNGLESPKRENEPLQDLERIDDQNTEEDSRLAMGGFRHSFSAEPAAVAKEEIESKDAEQRAKNRRH